MNLPIHPGDQKSMLRTLTRAIEIVQALPTRHDCEACDHYVNNHCARWNAAPPADVLPVGCESFESTVPF